MTTHYEEGDHEEFLHFLYSSEPKPKGTITLESPLEDPSKNIGLHIFEQLLMIFVGGLKYFYGNSRGKVDITELSQENIEKVNEYFLSMNYKVNLEVFPTINEYQFKFPDYFKNQKHITSETQLEDFFYEIFNKEKTAFRISFLFLN
jgi:hypothetical protein|tara:strand:- start:1204 stop:1644 length:441 start_codon:yes stop_codon:yes gene_type:complete